MTLMIPPGLGERVVTSKNASVFAYRVIVYLQTTLPAASFQHPPGPDVAFWL